MMNGIFIADPYQIAYKGTVLEADMKADKFIAATCQNRSVIIEVKSFLQPSFIHEFVQACGQYQSYVFLLQELGQLEKVYMAVSHSVYESEFGKDAVQLLVERFGIHLLVIDIQKEVIVQWIE